jgi:hypothetical protein
MSPENVLQRLNASLEEWDIVVYPIWTQWQRALDFAREVRRVRERHGAPPHPRVLILSFVEQLPVTVQWFRRTNDTGYSVFSSEKNLAQMLWTLRAQITEARRAYGLHLRFVHSGNASGLGCIPGEKLVAAYGSFLPGEEKEIAESESVLRFINLLATSRWRFRSASELVDLMSRHPFYHGRKRTPAILSVGSVKTYVRRAEDVP